MCVEGRRAKLSEIQGGGGGVQRGSRDLTKWGVGGLQYFFTEHKERVLIETSETSNSSRITFTPIDISNAFKSLKIGKACGVDGVSAEHFLYAHDILHVFLSLLFTSFITHGHLQSNFMKTALVPIIKNKTADTSDKNNYRPIALVTAASKIFEICILEVLEMYLITHDHQFGFKSKHSLSIFMVKSIFFWKDDFYCM